MVEFDEVLACRNERTMRMHLDDHGKERDVTSLCMVAAKECEKVGL